MIGLYQDPTGEKDVALRGLQAVKSMELGTTHGAGTVQALEAERDTLKMEVEQVHTVAVVQWGGGVHNGTVATALMLNASTAGLLSSCHVHCMYVVMMNATAVLTQ